MYMDVSFISLNTVLTSSTTAHQRKNAERRFSFGVPKQANCFACGRDSKTAVMFF